MHMVPSVMCSVDMSSKIAPPDGLALLKWTLQNAEDYFKGLGQRRVWLPKDRAMRCIRACQYMTDTLLHIAIIHLFFPDGICAKALWPSKA